jgi:hypothetical protein
MGRAVTMMDIDEFYEEDPARRDSKELALGSDWSSAADPASVFTLFWIHDTGELCLMRAPRLAGKLPGSQGPFGVGNARVVEPKTSALSVEVVARFATEEELQTALYGRDEAEVSADGVAWLDRLR